jgi:hypothetical protein
MYFNSSECLFLPVCSLKTNNTAEEYVTVVKAVLKTSYKKHIL